VARRVSAPARSARRSKRSAPFRRWNLNDLAPGLAGPPIPPGRVEGIVLHAATGPVQLQLVHSKLQLSQASAT
jgi:hypothetical protein